MKVSKSLLKNPEVAKYLQHIPDFKQKKTQDITTIVLTLIALSLFGIFAINPTVSTITELRRELVDNESVVESMSTKIRSLNTLQTEYNTISPDLPLLEAALPAQPQAPALTGQLQALGEQNGVQVIRIQVETIPLIGKGKDQKPSPTGDYSYGFSVTVHGTESQIDTFLTAVTNFDRIITLQQITLSAIPDQTDKWQLFLKGQAYYIPIK